MLKVSPILREFKTQKIKCLKMADLYQDALSDYDKYEDIKHETIEYYEGVNIELVPKKDDEIKRCYEELDSHYNKYVLPIEKKFKTATKKLIDIFYKVVEMYQEDLPPEIYEIYEDYHKIINFNIAKRELFIDLLLYEVKI